MGRAWLRVISRVIPGLEITSGGLVIHGDVRIHATGTITLTSDQHIVVSSGHNGDHYTHVISLNPLEDTSDQQ